MAEAQVQPRVSDTLLAKANVQGRVRVVVELLAPFRPEGNLPDATAVTNQRATIRDSAEAVLNRLSGQRTGSLKRFLTIPYVALEVDGTALRLLNTMTDVIRVEEDTLNRRHLFQSAPLVGAANSWASGATGAGWTVAIVDDGVDKNHPFLESKVVSEACYSTTSSFLNSTNLCPGGVNSTAPGSGANCPLPECDHGTHVAGIAAGRGPSFSGVARDASIIAIQVFSRIDSFVDCFPAFTCTVPFTSDIMLGLERVYQLRNTFNIAAANLSIGGSPSTTFCDHDPLKTIIDQLRSVGIATVISSGNDGYGDAISQPACISTAISVAATTKSDAVAVFSNTASFLSLFAPGENIYSSVPVASFDFKDGTSMAAPHVAGAWAVLKHRSPGASVSQILTALRNTGQLITDPLNGLMFPRIRIDVALPTLPQPRGDDIAIDLGPLGLWLRYNNALWSQLHSVDPEEIGGWQ
jgi:subtilisin family serine protease